MASCTASSCAISNTLPITSACPAGNSFDSKWSGNVALSGTVSTSNITSPTIYSINCTDLSGRKTSNSLGAIPAPTDLSAIAFTYPKGGETLAKDQPANITWTGSDAGINIHSVSLIASSNIFTDGLGRPTNAKYLGSVPASQNNFSWTITADIPNGAGYKIELTDPYGNVVGTHDSGTFTVANTAPPTVSITSVPAYASTGNASGKVLGNYTGYTGVAVYIYKNNGWWIKPNTASYLTTIGTGGTWSAAVDTLADDVYATKFSAFLIPSGFTVPLVGGQATLPDNLLALPNATINRTALAPTITITASPNPVASGSAPSITWSSNYSTSCTAPWKIYTDTFGTVTVPAQTSDTTYSISCTGPGGTSTNSVTVTVIQPPAISFTSVPDFGATTNLQGKVTGDYSNYQGVVIYIKVGTTWWVKPYDFAPLTTINSGGTWSANIVTGGYDRFATQINAYVIPKGMTVPAVINVATPPDSLTSLPMISVTRAVTAPTVSISATPNPVAFGGTPTVTWSSPYSYYCSAPWMPTTNYYGSTPGSAQTGSVTYSISCPGPGGTATNSVTVNVTPLTYTTAQVQNNINQTEHRYYADGRHFLSIVMGNSTHDISIRPHPGLDKNGWGSSLYLEPFLPGAVLRGTTVSETANSNGIAVTASGIVSNGSSSSYGTWNGNYTFTFNPVNKEVMGSGTYNINLSGALSSSTGDLNLYKLASNYLVNVPLNNNTSGNTGDMTQVNVSGGGAPNLTWVPTQGSTYPQDIRIPITVELIGNFNNVKATGVTAAYKPTVKVTLTPTQTSFPLIFGASYDTSKQTDFSADNVGITPLVLKTSSLTQYNFNMSFDSTAIAGDAAN